MFTVRWLVAHLSASADAFDYHNRHSVCVCAIANVHAEHAKSRFNANRFAHGHSYRYVLLQVKTARSTAASATVADRHDVFRGLFGGDRSLGDHVVNVCVCLWVSHRQHTRRLRVHVRAGARPRARSLEPYVCGPRAHNICVSDRPTCSKQMGLWWSSVAPIVRGQWTCLTFFCEHSMECASKEPRAKTTTAERRCPVKRALWSTMVFMSEVRVVRLYMSTLGINYRSNKPQVNRMMYRMCRQLSDISML